MCKGFLIWDYKLFRTTNDAKHYANDKKNKHKFFFSLKNFNDIIIVETPFQELKT